MDILTGNEVMSGATVYLDRDGRGFFITFTIEEGQRYRFGTVEIETALPSLRVDELGKYLLTRSGKWYNAEKVEKTVEALTLGSSLQGYAFAQVKPRFDRDVTTNTINVAYVIAEGPRIYIERINIVGNFRTQDDVIRRQFRLAEGDAFNRLLVEAARKRLRALGFFKTVEVDTEIGSAIVNVEPFPGPSLEARTDPPCSSTRWRTIESPRPKPPY